MWLRNLLNFVISFISCRIIVKSDGSYVRIIITLWSDMMMVL